MHAVAVDLPAADDTADLLTYADVGPLRGAGHARGR